MKNLAINDIPAYDDNFYPTPRALAAKMADKLDVKNIRDPHILEPQAGKGDLAFYSVAKLMEGKKEYYNKSIILHTIEIDEHLRSALRYEFSREKCDLLEQNAKEYLNAHGGTLQMTEEESDEYWNLSRLSRVISNVDFSIVGHDFLTFDSLTKYDAIIMNPPFDVADLHLIHAIQLQERYGGQICCLLNSETIKNPFTQTRQVLTNLLNQYEVDVEIIEGAFRGAERKSDVEVAIVYLNIPAPLNEKSNIFERMKKAEEIKFKDSRDYEITAGDYIEQAITAYKVEVAASIELVKQYEALKPHMLESLTEKTYNYPILRLCLGDSGNHDFGINEYLQKVRKKYWSALFENPKFTQRLTSDHRNQYTSRIQELSSVDFCKFNIDLIAEEMLSSVKQGIEKAIMDLFEKLGGKFHWHPECDANIHYFNGWRTNEAYKIGMKVILPVNGLFSKWHKSNKIEVRCAYYELTDIEKVLDYLDTGQTTGYDLHGTLLHAANMEVTRNIYTKYFDVTFYKKGTMHLKFHAEAAQLIEKFNIYGAYGRGWLPPGYGTKPFASMAPEEQDAVKEFHGGDLKAYDEVIANNAYYLARPENNILALE